MENPRPEKVAVVEEVRARLESSGAAVLTEYRGLNVAATAELRRALRAAGGDRHEHLLLDEAVQRVRRWRDDLAR